MIRLAAFLFLGGVGGRSEFVVVRLRHAREARDAWGWNAREAHREARDAWGWIAREARGEARGAWGWIVREARGACDEQFGKNGQYEFFFDE